jgi:hypothetical protein
MKDEHALRLTASEFLASDRSGLNQQVANARWQFDSVPGHHVFSNLQAFQKPVSFRFIPKTLVC